MKHIKKFINKVEFKKDLEENLEDRAATMSSHVTHQLPGSSVSLGTVMSLNYMRRSNQI